MYHRNRLDEESDTESFPINIKPQTQSPSSYSQNISLYDNCSLKFHQFLLYIRSNVISCSIITILLFLLIFSNLYASQQSKSHVIQYHVSSPSSTTSSDNIDDFIISIHHNKDHNVIVSTQPASQTTTTHLDTSQTLQPVKTQPSVTTPEIPQPPPTTTTTTTPEVKTPTPTPTPPTTTTTPSTPTTTITTPSPPPQQHIKPHMLIVSRHHGAATDTKAMAHHFGFQTSRIDIGPWTNFGTNHNKGHKDFWQSGIIESMCNDYDLIAVTDNIWDSMMWVHYSSCWPKLLLITTNRYDMYLSKPQAALWHKNINKALKDTNFKYPIITANNPYEEFYMRRHGLDVPNNNNNNNNINNNNNNNNNQYNIPVIRSLGESVIPLDMSLPYDSSPPYCIYYHHDDASIRTYQNARKSGLSVECKIFHLPYGGPTAVRKAHAPFVFMPYQVSVMKMWENLRAGSIFMVPTVPFLQTLVSRDENGFKHISSALRELKAAFGEDHTTWEHYIDFYNPAFEPCCVQFSSWEDLTKIVTSKSWLTKEKECQNYAKYFPDSQLVLWHQLFEKSYPQFTLPAYTEEERQAAKIILKQDLP